MKKNIIIALFVGCITTSFTAIQSAEGKKGHKYKETRQPVTTALKNGQTVTISVFNPSKEINHKEKAVKLLTSNFKACFDSPFFINSMTWARADVEYSDGLAFAGVALYSTTPSTGTVDLNFLVVDPDEREKGVGKALVKYVETTPNCSTMQLTSTPNAEPFYRTLGLLEPTIGEFHKAL